MERLTFEVHDGGMFVKEFDVKTYTVEDEIMHTGNAVRKLAEYEDLEDRFQSVYGECDGLLEKVVEHLERHEGIDLPEPVFKARLLTDGEVDRWEEYEYLEEQGKLLKLPCAVGDRICVIDTDERISDKEIKVYNIDNIVITSDGIILLKYNAHNGIICELENIITDKPYLDFYRCFLSQEEAEAALKEL